MLFGKLGVGFSSTAELLYPKMKFRLRLIRTRPSFYMIGDNPNVSVGLVDCSPYTRHIALKDDYHKETCLHTILWSSITWGLQQWFLTLPLDETSSSMKIFLTKLQFVQLLLQGMQIKCKLSIHSIAPWKSSLVLSLWSQSNEKTQKWSTKWRFWRWR